MCARAFFLFLSFHCIGGAYSVRLTHRYPAIPSESQLKYVYEPPCLRPNSQRQPLYCMGEHAKKIPHIENCAPTETEKERPNTRRRNKMRFHCMQVSKTSTDIASSEKRKTHWRPGCLLYNEKYTETCRCCFDTGVVHNSNAMPCQCRCECKTSYWCLVLNS